jgi:competence protein ComEA
MRLRLFSISIFCVAAVLLNAADPDELPPGKGKETFLRMCGNCHGLEQATNSKYPKKRWASVVEDMISRGADGTDEEVSTVVSYLSRHFGKTLNINTSTAKEIEAGLSFTAAAAELLVQYRSEKGPVKTYEDLLSVPGLDAKLLEEQKKNILF